MKWTNYMKNRYTSIMIGGTLLGVVLGVLAFCISYLICINFDIGNKGLLSSVFGLFIAVIAVIANHHYVASKLMLIEAMENIEQITKNICKKDN